MQRDHLIPFFIKWRLPAVCHHRCISKYFLQSWPTKL